MFVTRRRPAQGLIEPPAGQRVGVAQDYHLAAQWLTEAARQGEPYAELNLAILYADGNGVDRNLAQARELYAQAANGPVPEVAQRARQLATALPTPGRRRRTPEATSSWPGADTSSSASRPAPPPTPHCHEAPLEDPFTIRPGVYTPHAGSTLVRD